MLAIRQFLTVAGLTATETLRQPLCLLLTTTSVILTALVPLVTLHNFGEEGKLARDSGLAVHLVLGLFVAASSACAALSQEMQRGTASAILAKPVGRSLYFLAKFAGVAAVIVAFSSCASLSTLLAARVAERYESVGLAVGYVTDWQTGILHLAAPVVAFVAAGLWNYWTRRSFQSAAFAFLFAALVGVVLVTGAFDRGGYRLPYELRLEWRMVPASLLVTLALLVLAAVALTLSARLGRSATVALSCGVFVAGLLSDYAIGRFVDHSVLARALYAVVPNWQHFWLCDALSRGGTIPAAYVGAAAVYGACYTAAILGIGVLIFRTADMK